MELKAYERAGAIAEEVFSSIRTVFSYNGQQREEKRLNLIFNYLEMKLYLFYIDMINILMKLKEMV